MKTSGTQGNDTLFGLLGDDELFGLEGHDTLVGKAGNDLLDGGAGNDSLIGGSGDDILQGGMGADTLTGGDGYDTYLIDDIGDVINETTGSNQVISTVSLDFSLNPYVTDVLLSGLGNINVKTDLGEQVIYARSGHNQISTGDDADQIYAGAGDDVIDGGAGSDFMNGEAGADTYYIDDESDVVNDNFDDHNTAYTTSNFDFSRQSSGISTIHLISESGLVVTTSNAPESIFGSSGNDEIRAQAGNDTLVGNGGVDLLIGGTGDDWYIVSERETYIFEEVGEGSDTLEASVSFSMEENQITSVEVVKLVGSADLSLAGWFDQNVLIGNSGNNTLIDAHASNDTLQGMDGNDKLFAGDGDDLLDGGTGADSMNGGGGNDHFLVDNILDQVIEVDTTEGNFDLVESSVSFDLNANPLSAGVEGLLLTGQDRLTGVGNAQNNLMMANQTGSILSGRLGNDDLFGGVGADQLNGDEGHDILAGDKGQDMLNGGAGDDQIEGGEDGDYLIGGTGSDQYAFYDMYGTDLVNDVGGSNDVMRFLDVDKSKLWFKRTNYNLEVTQVGSTNRTLVIGWFSSPDNIEQITDSRGFEIDRAGISSLVNAMASFAPQDLNQASGALLSAFQQAWQA